MSEVLSVGVSSMDTADGLGNPPVDPVSTGWPPVVTASILGPGGASRTPLIADSMAYPAVGAHWEPNIFEGTPVLKDSVVIIDESLPRAASGRSPRSLDDARKILSWHSAGLKLRVPYTDSNQ